MDAFNTLREMSIFSGVADATIHQLIKQGEVVSIKAGEFFFREGSAADSMFLVEQGEAAVIKSWRGAWVRAERVWPRRRVRRDGALGPAAAKCRDPSAE